MQSPAVPQATDTAAAQTQSNIDTAKAQQNLNQVNQVTPTGSLTYAQTGTNPDGTPKTTATTALTPEQQAIFNKQQTTQGNLGDVAVSQSQRLGQLLSGGVDLNALPKMGDPSSVTGGPIQSSIANAGSIQNNLGPSDFSSDRSAVESSLFNRLNPQLDRQDTSLRTRLAGQGIKEGSEAWNNAIDAENRQRNDLGLAITAQGLGEQQGQQGLALNRAGLNNQAQAQQFGQNASQAGLSNSAQQQGFNQANTGFANANTSNQLGLSNLLTSQNQPLNQLLAVAGQGGVTQPSFASTPQSGVQGTDVAGAINNQYSQQLGQTNATNNAIGSAAGTIGGWLFSSPSLKTDVHDTGMETKDGIPLKEFRYKKSPMLQLGVMAPDVKKVRPDAVRKVGNFEQVNYSRIGSPMLQLGRKAA